MPKTSKRKERKRQLRNIKRQQKTLKREKQREEIIRKTLAFIEKERMFENFSEFNLTKHKNYD